MLYIYKEGKYAKYNTDKIASTQQPQVSFTFFKEKELPFKGGSRVKSAFFNRSLLKWFSP